MIDSFYGTLYIHLSSSSSTEKNLVAIKSSSSSHPEDRLPPSLSGRPLQLQKRRSLGAFSEGRRSAAVSYLLLELRLGVAYSYFVVNSFYGEV